MAASDYVQILFDQKGNIVPGNKFLIKSPGKPAVSVSLYKLRVEVDRVNTNRETEPLLSTEGNSNTYLRLPFLDRDKSSPAGVSISSKEHSGLKTKSGAGVPLFITTVISYYVGTKIVSYYGVLSKGYYEYSDLIRRLYRIPEHFECLGAGSLNYEDSDILSNPVDALNNVVSKPSDSKWTNYAEFGKWSNYAEFGKWSDSVKVNVGKYYKDLLSVNAWCGIIPEHLKALREYVKSGSYDDSYKVIPTRVPRSEDNPETPLIGLMLGQLTDAKRRSRALSTLKNDIKIIEAKNFSLEDIKYLHEQKLNAQKEQKELQSS